MTSLAAIVASWGFRWLRRWWQTTRAEARAELARVSLPEQAVARPDVRYGYRVGQSYRRWPRALV